MQYFRRYYIVYVLVFCFVCGTTVAVSRRLEQALPVMAEREDTTVIVIDPGHGGEDGGAVSPTGTKESDLNLAVSLRLNDLCRLLGMQTKLLRSTDVALYKDGAETVSQKKVSDLRHRVELVSQTPNAILISVHQNSFPEERYHGAQVFYAESEGSQALAETMQETINSRIDPDNHRVCKRSEMVYLMEKVRCPAVLLECGFLTNAAEEARLKTPAYQKQLVCAVAASLLAFGSS